MTDDELQSLCQKRLSRTLAAVGLLYEGRDYVSIRASIEPTAQLSIPTLKIKVQRELPANASGRRREQTWTTADTALQSDIEAVFFRGEHSRPSLRRRGLFASSKVPVTCDAISIVTPSAHARLAAIAEVHALGASYPP